MSRASRRSRTLECLEPRCVPAVISVAPITVTEPVSNGQAVFTATLAEASTAPITLSFATANGTARAGQNYIATSASVLIPAGQTSATFSVPLLGNNLYEGNLAFSVRLSTGRGNSVTRRVTATIVDRNGPPAVAISDLVIPEGGSGQVSIATEQVTLSGPASKAVRISYQTAPVSANDFGPTRDFVSTRGTLVIRPGATSGVIKVRVLGNNVPEPDKVFNVDLTGATNATLTTANPAGVFGRVVIRDDDSTDARPTLSVSGQLVPAGTAVAFTATLSAPAPYDVSFRYFTQPGTAPATQFTPVNNIATIPAGQTSVVLSVPTASQPVFSGTESFTLNLSAPANANLGRAMATGSISSSLQPFILSSNFSTSSSGTRAATGATWLAANFTTGSLSPTLSTATLVLSQVLPATETVAIYTDGGFQPGTLVGTLNPSSQSSTDLQSYVFNANNLALAADTSYWVVLRADTGTVNWSWTATNTGSGVGFTPNWSVSSDAGATWHTLNQNPFQLALVASFFS